MLIACFVLRLKTARKRTAEALRPEAVISLVLSGRRATRFSRDVDYARVVDPQWPWGLRVFKLLANGSPIHREA
jgi:hypothetical protein